LLFGLSTHVRRFPNAIVYAGFLFLPAAAVAWMMPEAQEERLLDPMEPMD